ncbi:MAG: ECF transporter S component [Ruminococcus sp.]|nr:ECF transporter S component [Ruminococcus sp.]
MNSKKTKLITLTALLTAFTTVSTMIIRIPTPTKGYVNLGDCLVNISAWLLGPVYGAAAAGIGSALADVFSGYIVYALATLIIKGAMAVASYNIYHVISKNKDSLTGKIFGALAAEIIMIGGYFIFESILYGSFTVAALGIVGNIAQGIMGIASSVVVYEAIIKRIPKITQNKLR